MLLQLIPHLALELGGAQVPRWDALEPRRVPIRDVDGQDPTHGRVVHLSEIDAGPELVLRDRRQRKRGVRVHHVAVHDLHVFIQVVLDAVHRREPQARQAAERRFHVSHQSVAQGTHDIAGKCRHVVVGLDRMDPGLVPNRHAGERGRVRVTRKRLHCRPEAERDTLICQVLVPGRQPDLARRPVQDPVEARRIVYEVGEETNQRRPGSSGADLPAPRSNQPSAEAVTEELLVRVGRGRRA